MSVVWTNAKNYSTPSVMWTKENPISREAIAAEWKRQCQTFSKKEGFPKRAGKLIVLPAFREPFMKFIHIGKTKDVRVVAPEILLEEYINRCLKLRVILHHMSKTSTKAATASKRKSTRRHC
eukprot:GHVP01009253.1.p2 GENE.GHVP01009253.1~~GHVP01009253.1.p2  ORF type:complete len:122 (-),score=10.29 GHVP01009253.1:841-1206(-)